MRKIFLPLMAILLFVSCQKETKNFTNVDNDEITDGVTATIRNKSSKISICHKTTSPANPWMTIEVNINALPDHLAHGDVVPDADGDGCSITMPMQTGA